MDFFDENFKLEEVDPWHQNDKGMVNLKDAIEIDKLTTGVDFEIISKEDNKKEEKEKEKADNLLYQERLLEHLNLDCMNFGEEVAKEEESMTPFAKMALGMEDLTGDGKVLKKILREGTGPVVPDGAMVRVHYNGYLEYCDEPYDSSRLRNKEQQFKLGRGDVIGGWDVGVATMKKSELARFLVDPLYAFGQMGCPPRIPPNTTILFEIEVISFVDIKVADTYETYSKEEKEQTPLSEIIAVANAVREEGNDLFFQKNFPKACNKYKKAIRMLEKRRLKNVEEEEKWKNVLVKLYLNQSLCFLRMHKPRPAITSCRNVLDLEGGNVKAVFRLGQAYMQLSEFDKSRKHLIWAGKLSPANVEIRQELVKLDRLVKKCRAVEKTVCSRMFPSEQSTKSGGDNEDSDNDDDENEKLTPKKLEEYRKLYQDQFSSMSKNPHMLEYVVPLPIHKKEQACAKAEAAKLDLLTEMIPGRGLRVYKTLPKELEDLQQ